MSGSRKWTTEDDDLLRRLHKLGSTPSMMSRIFQRTETAIAVRLSKKGLTDRKKPRKF